MIYDEKAVTGQRDLSQPLQEVNDSESFSRKPEKRRDDFEVLKRRSLSKGYSEGHLSVILNLAVKGNDSSVGIRYGQGDIEAVNRSVFVLDFHAIDSRYGKEWDQKMVFVVNVKVMDGANIAVPSLVRFNALHQELEQRRFGIYFSGLDERGFKVLPIFSNDEFSAGWAESVRTNNRIVSR
jgi:hypothetical protein